MALGAIRCRITERMHELSDYIDHDVEPKLGVTCGIFRVDVGNQFARLNERHQNLEQGVENVANAVDSRLVENNHRNNAQERTLGKITTTLLGLIAKMEQNIKDTRQTHENNTKMEKRMGGK